MKETKQAAASPEARAARRELMKAFEAFREANNARLDAIEKKAGDPLLEEKVARIDSQLAKAERRMERLRDAGRATGLASARAGAAPDEIKQAWHGYLRAGLEMKSGLAGTGGPLAPPETERLIERRLMAASPMREIASVRTVSTGVFRKPVSIAGVEAGWVAEIAARPETTGADLALLEFPSAELYASPAATQALLDDALVNIDEWLAAEVEDAFAAQETEAFVLGDGINRPRGFLSYERVDEADHVWGKIGQVSSGEDGGFGEEPVDRLIELIYAPKAKYRANARFVMNRRTASAIRRFRDADGNHVWSPATEPGATSRLMGYPVTEIETMPDVGTDAPAVAFGDFEKGYLIVDRAGLSVLRDPYSAKPYVLFYTTKRVGGGVQDFDAIKVLTLSGD